jgi:hypothetical protein
MKYIVWWRGSDPKPGPYNNIDGLPWQFDSAKDAVSFILNHLGRSYFRHKQLYYDVKTWPKLELVYQFPNNLTKEISLKEEAIVHDDLSFEIVPEDPSRAISTSKTWYKKAKA